MRVSSRIERLAATATSARNARLASRDGLPGVLALCLLAAFAAAPVILPADLARLAFPPFSSTSSDLALGDVPSTFHAGSRPASVADNDAIQDDAPPIGAAESGRPPVLEPLGALIARRFIAHGCTESCRRRDRKSTRLNSSHIQKSRMPSSA